MLRGGVGTREARSGIETGQGLTKAMMRPRRRGTSWPVETAVSANAVSSYFIPTRVTGVTSVTALRAPAERPARPPARHAGAPPRRTGVPAAHPAEAPP